MSMLAAAVLRPSPGLRRGSSLALMPAQLQTPVMDWTLHGTLALYHCVLQLRALRNEWLYDWRGLEFQQVVPRLATHLSHLLYLSWKSLNGKAMCIYVLLRAEQGSNDQFLFSLIIRRVDRPVSWGTSLPAFNAGYAQLSKTSVPRIPPRRLCQFVHVYFCYQ